MQLSNIPRNEPAPKPSVYPEFACRGSDLFLECGYGCRCRDAVQRHFNQGSDATGSSRLGCSGESFPFRTPRLVDVHVGVDQARHNRKIAGIVNRRAGWDIVICGNTYDYALLNSDCSCALAIWGDDSLPADNKISLITGCVWHRRSAWHFGLSDNHFAEFREKILCYTKSVSRRRAQVIDRRYLSGQNFLCRTQDRNRRSLVAKNFFGFDGAQHSRCHASEGDSHVHDSPRLNARSPREAHFRNSLGTACAHLAIEVAPASLLAG